MNLIYWPQVVGPVAASSGLANDPYWSFVVQMAHFEDAPSASTYLNSATGKGTTIGNISNSATSTAQFKWPPQSLSTSHTVNSGARATSSTDYAFGTSDWTIEFWLYPKSLTLWNNSARVYFDMRDSVLTSAWAPSLSGNTALGSLRYVGNGAARIDGGNCLTVTAWQHVALCRNSGTTRLFVGGSQVGSDFVDSNTYVAGPLSVSFAGNSGGACDNYYQDLRITNGVGRYTTTFTVPAGPFPNQ